MAKDYLVSEDELSAIANEIRSKTGSTGPIEFPAGFVTEIASISGGGGDANEFVVNFLETTPNPDMNEVFKYITDKTADEIAAAILAEKKLKFKIKAIKNFVANESYYFYGEDVVTRAMASTSETGKFGIARAMVEYSELVDGTYSCLQNCVCAALESHNLYNISQAFEPYPDGIVVDLDTYENKLYIAYVSC